MYVELKRAPLSGNQLYKQEDILVLRTLEKHATSCKLVRLALLESS